MPSDLPDEVLPLSPKELNELRAEPIVNRNGSTGRLVDRLIATIDNAWSEVGHLRYRLAATETPDTTGPQPCGCVIDLSHGHFAATPPAPSEN